MYGLLTRREVKMTGYWPSSFFACLWTAHGASHIIILVIATEFHSVSTFLVKSVVT